MDDVTRAAFGRMDRYFELIYGEVRSNGTRLDSIEGRLGAVEGEVQRLSNELRAFRDWVVTQFAELRTELKRFSARLDRLERQRDPRP